VVNGNFEKVRGGRNGVARKVHVGQGLEQHHLVAVHFALAPQAFEFGLADADAPLAGQVVQRGITGVVAGAVVFCFRVAETGDQPDISCIHSYCVSLFFENSPMQLLSITYARAKRYTF